MISRRGYAMLFLLVDGALATAGRAQTAVVVPSQVSPSQVTPQTFQPPRPPPGDPGVQQLSIGGTGAAAPAGSENFRVVVQDLVVEGEFAELASMRSRIADRILGQKLTIAQIFETAADIEAAYARAGYVFVRVSVPPQRLAARGPVRLIVTDGYIEAIDTQALSPRVRDVVAARLAGLIGARRMKAHKLEQKLLVAGDVAGLRLRSVLTRGDEPGGVKLVLNGDHRLVSGTLTVDNRNGVSLGRWQFGTSLALNSPWGRGEQVFASLTTDSDVRRLASSDPRLRIFGAGVALPVGVDGLTVTPEYSNSRTHAKTASGGLDTVGEFERWALRLNAPILRSRTQALAASVSAEHLTQIAHSTLFGRDTSRDEYAVLRGSLDWSASTTSGAGVSASLTAARGLGGRDRDDGRRTAIPLSRLGADPEFTKAGFTAQAVQPLPYGGLRASVTVAGQTSFNAPLLRSEQLALDGSSLVSGIASGTLSVDRGLAGRAELARPIAVATGAGQATATPYLFMALGLGYLELPTALEAARVSGRSLGGGVRFDVAESGKMPGLNVALEIAHHASYIATTKRGSRVSLSVASRF